MTEDTSQVSSSIQVHIVTGVNDPSRPQLVPTLFRYRDGMASSKSYLVGHPRPADATLRTEPASPSYRHPLVWGPDIDSWQRLGTAVSSMMLGVAPPAKVCVQRAVCM